MLESLPEHLPFGQCLVKKFYGSQLSKAITREASECSKLGELFALIHHHPSFVHYTKVDFNTRK